MDDDEKKHKEEDETYVHTHTDAIKTRENMEFPTVYADIWWNTYALHDFEDL